MLEPDYTVFEHYWTDYDWAGTVFGHVYRIPVWTPRFRTEYQDKLWEALDRNQEWREERRREP